MNITDGDLVLSDSDDEEYLPGNEHAPQKVKRVRQEKYVHLSVRQLVILVNYLQFPKPNQIATLFLNI